MYLEQFTFKSSSINQIPVDHPAYWTEGFLKGQEGGMSKQVEHDAEHVNQLLHWGCKPEQTAKLSIRKDENGEYFSDRLYHVMLHLAYWKETSQDEKRLEAVKRFEQQFNFNLDELTRPEPAAETVGTY